MAEGLLRHLSKGRIEVHSAGLFSAGLHPRAMAVMREIGIDISNQRSKEIDEALLKKMDIVITLCGNAEAYCPATPQGIKRLHWPIDDPVGLRGTEAGIINAFRKTRDEIKDRITAFLTEAEVSP